MNDINAVILWLAAAIILGIVEAATVSLTSIWFAIGAVAAMIPAYFGTPLWVQILVFVLVSLICFACTRTFYKDVIKVKKQPTNADSLIGTDGIVTEDICNIEGKGKVYILGLTWSARSVDGEKILKDTIVKVERIEGATLLVKKNSEEK